MIPPVSRQSTWEALQKPAAGVSKHTQLSLCPLVSYLLEGSNSALRCIAVARRKGSPLPGSSPWLAALHNTGPRGLPLATPVPVFPSVPALDTQCCHMIVDLCIFHKTPREGKQICTQPLAPAHVQLLIYWIQGQVDDVWRTDGWISRWVGDWTNWWIDEWMGEWVDGWMGRWMSRWVNGWMDG